MAPAAAWRKCQANDLFDETMRNLYDGVTTTEVDKAMIMSAKARIENEPAYTYVAARLLLNPIYEEVLQFGAPDPRCTANISAVPAAGCGRRASVAGSVEVRLDQRTPSIWSGISSLPGESDDLRSLPHLDTRIETPQYFYMRVSGG